MTIHFAAATNPDRSPVARILQRPAKRVPANDNAALHGGEAPSDIMLRAALKHFAQHGLGAARVARTKAENAFFAGDRGAYDWWLSITRTLDRRLADAASCDQNRG
jgi:hypothetical protein